MIHVSNCGMDANNIVSTNALIKPSLIQRTHCAICKSPDVPEIYRLNDNVPINLKCTVEPDMVTSSLSYGACKECGVLQLRYLMPLDVLYGTGDSHNTGIIGNVWKKFYDFLSEIVQRYTNGKTVLEIGDPSGKILSMLENYRQWIIVEPNPSRELLEESSEKIHVIPKFFDRDAIEIVLSYDQPEVIVHSHVFEHMYDPGAFLEQCWSMLPENGKMVFAIPNMSHIVHESLAPCFGVFFEHTVYMDENVVGFLLENARFLVDEVYHYENHSTLFVTRKVNRITSPKYTKSRLRDHIQTFESMFHDTITEYLAFVQICNERMKATDEEDYFIFGASYNTQMLFTLGLNKDTIVCILDNSKVKHDKYLQGTSLMVCSPSTIKSYSKPCVILKSGYYTNEIRKQLQEMNPTVTLLCT